MAKSKVYPFPRKIVYHPRLNTTIRFAYRNSPSRQPEKIIPVPPSRNAVDRPQKRDRNFPAIPPIRVNHQFGRARERPTAKSIPVQAVQAVGDSTVHLRKPAK